MLVGLYSGFCGHLDGAQVPTLCPVRPACRVVKVATGESGPAITQRGRLSLASLIGADPGAVEHAAASQKAGFERVS